MNSQKESLHLSLNMLWGHKFNSSLPINHLRQASPPPHLLKLKKKKKSNPGKRPFTWLLCTFLPFDLSSNFLVLLGLAAQYFYTWDKIIFPIPLMLKQNHAMCCLPFMILPFPSSFCFLLLNQVQGKVDAFAPRPLSWKWNPWQGHKSSFSTPDLAVDMSILRNNRPLKFSISH